MKFPVVRADELEQWATTAGRGSRGTNNSKLKQSSGSNWFGWLLFWVVVVLGALYVAGIRF
ncbi:MAG: hypothetical protein HYY02_12820 [Chloroflexi bacterium]|nr:hypothetical protein [Chloroflexota bacterium]